MQTKKPKHRPFISDGKVTQGRSRDILARIDWVNQLINLIIVIVGVTVAFAFNSWAEEKRAHAKEKAIIKNIIKDFESDLADLKDSQLNNERFLNRLQHVIQILKKEPLDFRLVYDSTRQLNSYTTFIPVHPSFVSLGSSYDLTAISSDSLRKKIVNLFFAYSSLKMNENGGLVKLLEDYYTPFWHKNFDFLRREPIDLKKFNTVEYSNILLKARNYLNSKNAYYIRTIEITEDMINSLKKEIGEKE
jgi:hypothetical protein